MKKNKIKKFEYGLSEEIISKISNYKNERNDMLIFRLKAYNSFLEQRNPKWSKDIDNIDFNKFIYFISHDNKVNNNWEDIPDKIKNTFKQLGILEAEAKFLNGVSTQYDSEVIYHKNKKELEEMGIIFCDTDTAYREHHDLFMKYFNKIVPYTDNKYAALNSCVWSGGTFIYVPKNVVVTKPLQSYFRINSQSLGQFERTLIIVDDNASLHYIEGCTAPIYSSNNLHAAVVEIFVGKNAKMKYTTIQNWSNNVLNYVTKRAIVDDYGSMSWIDGNIGSKHNIKFPCCILKGDYAKGECISIAVANSNVIQDTGAKMIHIGKNTRSNIVSKSIGHKNSKSIFRGFVNIQKSAINSYANVTCDTLLLEKNVLSETIPYENIENNSSFIKHEASVSRINQEQLNYLMSRGINYKLANHLLVLGFIDIFTKELPMEYAVELNRLLKMEI